MVLVAFIGAGARWGRSYRTPGGGARPSLPGRSAVGHTAGVQRSRAALLASLAALAFFLWARAPWPDDWDGVGFVHAVRDFDLARFRPHFPGYPVYVALARALRPLAASDALAASAASAVGGALLVLAGTLLLGRRGHAVWVAAMSLASPVVALAATSVGSDALGAGLLAMALACAARARGRASMAVAAGVWAGLALGARPGNAVEVAIVAAAWAGARWRARERGWRVGVALALGACALTCAAWLAVLVARHGVAGLWELGSAQVRGHFGTWGGSVGTDRALGARAVRVGQVLLGDVLGGGTSLMGAVRAGTMAALAGAGLARLGARRARWVVAAVGVLVGYALVAQNVDEPRHLLLPACALAGLAALGLSEVARSGRRRGALVALAMAVGMAWWPTSGALRAHHDEQPPGLALARWIAAQGPAREAVLFGGRAARFAELEGIPMAPRTWMGEVEASLARVRRWPRRIYLTSEVAFRARAQGAVRWERTFCRDARATRGSGCVGVYRYEVGVGVSEGSGQPSQRAR
jgi:hypothetical protein